MAGSAQAPQRTVFSQLLSDVDAARKRQDETTYSRHWRRLGVELDKLATGGGDITNQITQIVQQQVGGNTGNNNGNGSGGTPTTADNGEEPAPVLAGESVVVGSALYFSSGSGGQANAADTAKICDAFCTRLVTVNGVTRCYWITNGNKIKAKLEPGLSGLTPGTRLYLSSISPGSLTSATGLENPATQFTQECGRFVRYATDSTGNSLASVALINVHIAPVSSLPSAG